MGHTYIGSEHLLLGLLLEGSGAAYHCLTQNGVEPEAVLDLLIKTVGRGIQSKLSPSDMTPVSYTHLDVYKRQVPMDALVETAEYYLKLENFDKDNQVMEKHLL